MPTPAAPSILGKGDVFIPRGVAVPALDGSIAWEFAPTGFKVGRDCASSVFRAMQLLCSRDGRLLSNRHAPADGLQLLHSMSARGRARTRGSSGLRVRLHAHAAAGNRCPSHDWTGQAAAKPMSVAL